MSVSRRNRLAALAMLLSLVPLLLPHGIAVSVCLKTHAWRLHAKGHGECDAASACCGSTRHDSAVESEVAASVPSCCAAKPAVVRSCCAKARSVPESATPGASRPEADSPRSCGCCVEIASVDDHPPARLSLEGADHPQVAPVATPVWAPLVAIARQAPLARPSGAPPEPHRHPRPLLI